MSPRSIIVESFPPIPCNYHITFSKPCLVETSLSHSLPSEVGAPIVLLMYVVWQLGSHRFVSLDQSEKQVFFSLFSVSERIWLGVFLSNVSFLETIYHAISYHHIPSDEVEDRKH